MDELFSIGVTVLGVLVALVVVFALFDWLVF